MKKLTSLTAVSTLMLMLVLLNSTPALAATIFFDNFNSGFAAWTAAGVVTSVSSPAIQPNSVRLNGAGASITKTISTVGYTTISVTWNMAASTLEDGEFCYVEYNTGSGWVTLGTVANGQDNSNFFSGTTNNISGADQNANFQVRYRIQTANASGDYCYAEDMTVSGTSGSATNTPTSTSTPSGPTPTPTNTSTGGGGGGVPGDPLTGDGNVTRTLLTYANLTTSSNPSGPVDDSAFAVPANAAVPLHTFEGRLVLNNEAASGGFNEIQDTFHYTGAGDSPKKHLPEFDFQFVQNGSHLIPAIQGLHITGHSDWNIIVGPGRAWKENSDNGWSRAAFPFALVQRNANCVHNGSMTFLFNSTSVSFVRYQITQETCLYFKFDQWGQLSATYTSGTVSGANTLKNDHALEVTNRIPVKPISALTTDFPGSGVNLSAFGKGISATHMTYYGLVINGTNYVAGCGTRFGTYSFCADMRVPSYSTAKSTFAGVGFMRVGQTHGSGVSSLLIRNYVSEYTNGGVWTNVTFNHTMDMTTGNYRSGLYMNDEGTTYADQFFLAEPYSQKIIDAFDDWPSKDTPGTTWVYHTWNQFIVVRGLGNYIGSDLFNAVRDNVYIPLKLSKGGQTSLRTDNSASGAAFGGYGLFYNRDDIVKLAKLLNNDGGQIGGTQVLNSAMLNATMQKNASDRGMTTTGTTAFKYNNGVWAKEMTPSAFPQYSCTHWVPFMSGYGGITVAMMTNGSTYYYFSDNDEFNWYDAVHESNKLIPHCP
jgi:hypothetical protein